MPKKLVRTFKTEKYFSIPSDFLVTTFLLSYFLDLQYMVRYYSLPLYGRFQNEIRWAKKTQTV